MSTPGLLRSSSTRSVKKLEKPRPLKISGNQNRNSSAEISPRYSIGSWDDLMLLVDNVSQCIANQNCDESLFLNIVTMSSSLKMYGQQLESVYKDQLDRAFVIFRNGCGNERVNYFCRLYLLELIELRANQWLNCDNICSYYNTKMATPDSEPLATTPDALSSGVGLINLSATSPMNTTVLSPGEVLKASGKFPKPTKIPGKNYCKDEVVIRNSDSGKVMGIKGRRVHMIEELSETIISFQRGFVRPMIIKSPFTWTTARPHYPDYHYVHPNIPQCWVPSMKVNPGAKERLVQITGPTEDKITHARQLMEDTIRRNASPVREVVERERMGGSSSSLNSSASDESNRLPQTGIRPKTLLHSFSTNDANIGEYKYTVTLGNETIKITGKNLELVRNAKLILEEYYNDWSRRNDNGDCYRPGDEDVFMSPSAAAAGRYVGSYDSGNGNPSTSTSGESDDITCISALPNSIAIPGTRNLDYSPTQQQSYPGSHPERRAVLGRSVSLYTNNHLLPYSSSYEDTVGTSRVYSRDFLLECSMSHLSKLVPPGWERITKEFPAIVQKMTSPFDPKAFAKRSIESCLATSVISSTFNTETGSPESD